MEQYLQAKVIHADLVAIDLRFTEKGIGGIDGMLLLKQSLISVANFFDFELTVRSLYKEYPELCSDYRTFQKECEFAKYLRNKFVGHLKSELINKTLEWNPSIRLFLDKMDDPNVAYIVNNWILETAINTYVDQNGKHKIFDSETDLHYPPNMERFLKYLTLIIRSSIAYLTKFIKIKRPMVEAEVEHASTLEGGFDLARIAGQTEFTFIKK